MEEEDREWGWLPKNLLHSISDKLWRMNGWMDDVIRFNVVSVEVLNNDRRNWRISS